LRKTILIAVREYLAAVRTKSFLISLVVLPFMMFSGVIAQGIGEKFKDVSARRIAIIDRTPNAELFGVIQKAVDTRNANGLTDSSGTQVRSKFELEKVEPAELGSEAADQQRLALSDRVRNGQLLAFLEIDDGILASTTQPAGATSGDFVHYSTNRPTYREFLDLLRSALAPAVFERRLAEIGIPYQPIRSRLSPPNIADRGLAEKQDGRIVYEPREKQVASLFVPVMLLLLMFIVVLVGATPLTANIIEEKTLRIAEVLLGSVRPMELMAGKLIGGVAVALTLAAIYFSGAYFIAARQGMTTFVPISTLLWFIFFTVVGTLMYGSMFLAAGAAVTNLKESQTMMMPVMLLITVPIIASISSLANDPSGRVATAASFFPFSAPMIMTARTAIPPGVPLWQALVSTVVVVLTTIVLVWVAGRIFRVGILMQGRGANYADLARWILRG
jgi:ABC-type Na+ efflux pump permease subunit